MAGQTQKSGDKTAARILPRLAIFLAAALLILGLFWSWRQWRYQSAYRSRRFHAASRIWPDRAQAWRQVAENDLYGGNGSNLAADFPAALIAAQNAVHDDPADWRNWQKLAQIALETGHEKLAHAAMAKMRRRSNGFLPRFLYANLMLADNRPARFWRGVVPALSVAPTRRIPAALNQCLIAANGHFAPITLAVRQAMRHAYNYRQAFRLQDGYLVFLGAQNKIRLANAWWRQIFKTHPHFHHKQWPQSEARHLQGNGFNLIQSDIGHGHAQTALRAWLAGEHAGVWGKWTDRVGLGRNQLIPDGAFQLPFNTPLAWQVCYNCGAYITRAPRLESKSFELRMDFTGGEPGSFSLAQQWLAISPGKNYQIQFWTRSRAENRQTGAPTGILLSILGAGGQTLLRISVPAQPEMVSSSSSTLRIYNTSLPSKLDFQAQGTARLLRSMAASSSGKLKWVNHKTTLTARGTRRESSMQHFQPTAPVVSPF